MNLHEVCILEYLGEYDQIIPIHLVVFYSVLPSSGKCRFQFLYQWNFCGSMAFMAGVLLKGANRKFERTQLQTMILWSAKIVLLSGRKV